MLETSPETVKDSIQFSNFAQRVKMKYWTDFNVSSKAVKEDDLDNILLIAWEDFKNPKYDISKIS